MADDNSVFSGVLNAIKGNRRAPDQSTVPGTGGSYQTMPQLDPAKGVETMQQDFLDWQVHKMSHDLYTRTVYFDTDRISAYQDFRAMDNSPEIAAALNIMRDECLTRGENGDILEIYSENDRVKNVLEDLFRNVLQIEFNLRLWIRDLIKYGDYMVYLTIDKEVGIYDFQTLPAEETHREEGYDGTTNSVRFRWETTGDYFEEWQVAHFRLLEDTKKLPYGRSMLDPARKLWKQLQLAEDAMLVYRITRAPERRVFYIEVGNLPDADVKGYVSKVQMALKKQPIVDQRTGNMNYKFDPKNVTEDYYIPIRGDKSSKIETLPGACIALDTKIPLLDGRTLELNEIIKEWDSGDRNLWVYSCDPESGKIAPGMITWAGETRKDAETLKITLDNGEVLVTTPDHKWVHRTNGFVEAQDLIVGDSIMPFYRDTKKIKSNNRNEYERVWDAKEQEWIFTHRMVTDFNNVKIKDFVFDKKLKYENKQVRHHKDYNRFNNNPNNLVWMGGEDHLKFHQSIIKETIWANPEENKRKIRDGINKFIKAQTIEERESRKQRSIINLSGASERLQELLKDEEYKKEFYKKTSKTLKIVKNTPEYKEKQRNIVLKQWQTEGHKEKVFSKKQTITFTETLYNMFFDMFKKNGRADLTLNELNQSEEFLSEFINNNSDIRSSLTNLNEFTRNHLDKMLKEHGFENYREWCKIVAEELGYKNVRAWRYYIEKENKSENKFYNHKITKIEQGEVQNTGTLTIDNNEVIHNFHTFATESGVFIKNSNLGEIQDIEYLQNKLFAAIQVPKSYLNYAEALPGGSTLSQTDLRFSRTINSIQEAVLLELRRIANVHLYFLGFEDALDNFKLTLTNPSTQQELLKLETMKARIEVFKELFSAEATSPTSYTYAMENILGFSKFEIKHILKQKKVEKKLFAEIESAVETYKKIGLFDELDEKFEDPEAAARVAAEGPGGEEGGDMGGGGGLGGAGDAGAGMDFGMDDGAEDMGEPGADAGAEAGGEELAESKLLKILKESDKRSVDLIDQLLEEEVEKPKKEIGIIKGSNKIKRDTKNLMEKIQNKLDDVDTTIKKTREAPVKTNSQLLENNESMLAKNTELFAGIDRLIEEKGNE